MVVGQDLADALKESPLGELDLTAAVRPALEAAARAFGPVVLDPGQLMEPGVALSAIAAKDDAVAVPLLDGGEVRAVVALALTPVARRRRRPAGVARRGAGAGVRCAAAWTCCTTSRWRSRPSWAGPG